MTALILFVHFRSEVSYFMHGTVCKYRKCFFPLLMNNYSSFYEALKIASLFQETWITFFMMESGQCLLFHFLDAGDFELCLLPVISSPL